MKTVALYSPYIPKHSGGGERYLLSIAESSSRSADTFLLVSKAQVVQTEKKLRVYEKTFGLDLSKVQVRSTVIGSPRSSVQIFQETRKYDVLFAMTDGSFFASGAKKSHLIIQVPWMRKLSVFESLKLSTWKSIIVYSDFVGEILKKSWKTSKIQVLSPYVDVHDFHPLESVQKEKLIISVGRFFSHAKSNSKKQDILIEAFKLFSDTHPKDQWHLALLGSVDPNPDSYAYIKKLKEHARGYSVSIHTDLSYDALRSFYQRASMYWHAAGYEVNESTHPENTEHFGITTLEAMASGCIPIVVPKGGQQEVVDDPTLYWNTPTELLQKTQTVLTHLERKDEEFDRISTKMQSQVHKYTKEVFANQVKKIL